MPCNHTKPNALNASDLLFSLALGFLLTHEMDAVAQAEWHILPLFSALAEQQAYVWFVLTHVPLYALILWLVTSTTPGIRWWAQASIDLFLVIHVGLHLSLSQQADYHFNNALSLVLIFGAGLCGLLHLILLLNARRKRSLN